MLVDPSHWSGRRVLVTGDTGFKGAWLSLWLQELGAEVTGLALPAEDHSLYTQLGLKELITHTDVDIRDQDAVDHAILSAAPQTVFHLAAQPIVRLSYDEPRETFATNVQGTVNVLDACRRVQGLKAIVAITSDKCYENREWIWPYRENDPVGGHDPYSASKGAAELVVASYQSSFFHTEEAPLLASVRAGNVIGGGDWASDRLVPDIIRALAAEETVVIRSPQAVRPWQHVLEALGGYLLIAQGLAEGDRKFASPWNFGPSSQDSSPVLHIVERLLSLWGGGNFEIKGDQTKHEAHTLKLDCSKAHSQLGWRPAFTLSDTLEWIVDWHKAYAKGDDMRAVSRRQLQQYRALMDKALTEGTEL
ncbi:CDP-glucose 4,6-dehydratase [Erythrobacter litoralis]|uniref:CDP-glucose 4,6-dehydratase n=1 Tax=Erythrobacter litoralis TaxID=39960 RepID=UPI002435000D|nr:CDP-glucose 4,6-dehydratase [Erythrobacter litoralis]MDG6079361.1 CDP-glucose 4,6-dehydratase [Erythrobacter litoralis]